MSDKKILGSIILCFAVLGLLGLRFGKQQAPISQTDQLQQPEHKKTEAEPSQTPSTPQKILNDITSQPGLVPVLMYHHVGDLPIFADAMRRDLTVSPADFAAQISLLDQLGYHTISAAQLDQALHGQTSNLPSKPIIITFDDGYDDVFQFAVPILQEHHMNGTFAIITGFVGRTGYASWSQITGAQVQGMEMVCHSEHHMDFSDRRYTHDMKVSEISSCKQDLQAHGISTSVFIYPYGHFNAETEQILRDQNFDLAFTTAFGIVNNQKNLLELPRVRVHGKQELAVYQKNLLK